MWFVTRLIKTLIHKKTSEQSHSGGGGGGGAKKLSPHPYSLIYKVFAGMKKL